LRAFSYRPGRNYLRFRSSATSFDHELNLTAALVDNSEAILRCDELVIPEFGNALDYRRGEQPQRHITRYIGAFHQHTKPQGAFAPEINLAISSSVRTSLAEPPPISRAAVRSDTLITSTIS